jgi:hypothetical protein
MRSFLHLLCKPCFVAAFAALVLFACESQYSTTVDLTDVPGSGTMSVVVRSPKLVSVWQSVQTTPDGHSGLVGRPSSPGKFYLRGMRPYVDSSDNTGYFYRYEMVEIYGGVNQVKGVGSWTDLEGFYMPDAYNESAPDHTFYTNRAHLYVSLFDQVAGHITGQFSFKASRFDPYIDTVNVTGTFELFTTWK